MSLSVVVRFVFIIVVTLSVFACGGGSTDNNSSNLENTNNNNIGDIGSGNTDTTNGNDATTGSDTPVNSQTQSLTTVMVSSSPDLSNAQPLDGANIGSNVYIFFLAGSDWESRNVERVVFYCCQGGTSQHTIYPAAYIAPYSLNIDLSQYTENSVYEFYADVFFENQFNPEPFLVNFTVTNSTTVPGPLPSNTSPTINGTPPNIVNETTNYTFTPISSDVDGDNLTFSIVNQPSWSNFNPENGSLSGIPSSTDIGTYSNITISVTDGMSTASLPSFSIQVTQLETPGFAVLNWSPPSLNADNTPLTDLAGYNIYYGTSLGNYPNVISIPNPGITSYTIDNLPGSNTYYFVVTAIDVVGNESEYSNVASKILP